MKVKCINNSKSSNAIEQVLSNRKIDESKFKYYLEPNHNLMPNYKLLDNIYKGIELLKRHVRNKSNIGIIVDSDFDGLTSTAIFYKFLINYCNIDKDLIKLILPRRKSHGINMEDVLDVLSEGDLLIVPDAGSSDFEQHEELQTKSIACLIVDHHLAPKKETSAVIINNQLSDLFPNKALTGSAMSYLFCKGYLNENNCDDPVDLLDLAAMGLVADRADFSKDLGAYYMMRLGLKSSNINSKLLKKVIEKNGNLEENTDLNAKDIGFNVAPIFNSVFRMGKPDELEQVIHGICEFDYELYNSRKKANQSIIEEAYLRAMSVKRRQKKQEDEIMEKIQTHIKEKNSDKYKILIVNSTGIVKDSGMNGLVAMKLVREYNKPVLMVTQVGDKFKGSARNLNNSPIEDLNKFLSDTGYFICRGHANAFGVEFNLEDALTIQQELETKLVDVDIDDVEYEVDFEWSNFIDIPVIHDLASHKNMWCNGLDEPLIYIKNIYTKKDDFKFIGKTGNTLKLSIQGVDFIKFRINEDEKREIAMSEDTSYLSLVCTASVNTYRGMNIPQLMIEDFTLVPAKERIMSSISLDELPF
ncbi:DHH family phosphoesterase [Staphylococcus chromogenes]|uniref:DHH family phosphoesterase n=1 Tax=Staphylococcus chromogenes TaxID=46126 RepID=UPI0028841201|nr:DHH family phosphoesterase [Staphylococcus chromogenes]MDT0700389.1 DHH family phosphoesterase [Staphylococcus chromogenes]